MKTEPEDRGQPERALVGLPLLIAGRVVTLSVGSGVRVRKKVVFGNVDHDEEGESPGHRGTEPGQVHGPTHQV